MSFLTRVWGLLTAGSGDLHRSGSMLYLPPSVHPTARLDRMFVSDKLCEERKQADVKFGNNAIGTQLQIARATANVVVYIA